MKTRVGLRLRVVGLVSLLLVVVFGWFIVLFSQKYADQLRTELFKQADQFASLATKPIGDVFIQYKDSGRLRITQQVENFTALNESVSNVRIYDILGNLLYENQGQVVSQGVGAEFISYLEDVHTSYIYGDDEAIASVVSPLIEDSGIHRYTIVYDIDSTSISNTVSQTVNIIIAAGALTVLLMIFTINLLLEFLLVKPVTKLKEAATKVSKHAEDATPIPVLNRSDEIGDLSRSVKVMSEKLQDDIKKLRELDKSKSEFMALSSHYLRTPITILKACMEALTEDESNNPKAKITALNNATKATEQLYELTEDILLIASFETNSDNLQVDKLKLSELLNFATVNYAERAKEKGLEYIRINSSKDPVVGASKQYFKIALDNVFENALKFTKQGSVTLECSVEVNTVSIMITDTGVGIDKEELKNIFGGFHIGSDYMTVTESKTGLGLRTTKLIVEKHNGTVNVDSTKSKGTQVTISLPIV